MLKIILFYLISFSAYSVVDGEKITKSSFDNSLFQVGDIKYSLLTEAQFQASHGTCWTLLDGKPISGSDFASEVSATLPDGRGMFLRSKQNTRNDGKGNPNGEVNLGATQNRTSNIPYQFEYTAYASNTTPINVSEDGSWSSYMTLAASGGNYARPFRARNRGGESRPDNLTINHFVKINKNCN